MNMMQFPMNLSGLMVCFSFFPAIMYLVIPRFWQTSSQASLSNYCFHHVAVVAIKYRMGKPANVELKKNNPSAITDANSTSYPLYQL